MRDFLDIDEIDSDTLRAIIDFASQLKKNLGGELSFESSEKAYNGGMAFLLGKSIVAGILSNKKVPTPGTGNFLY